MKATGAQRRGDRGQEGTLVNKESREPGSNVCNADNGCQHNDCRQKCERDAVVVGEAVECVHGACCMCVRLALHASRRP